MNTINKVIRVTHNLLSDETQTLKDLIGDPGNNNKKILLHLKEPSSKMKPMH